MQLWRLAVRYDSYMGRYAGIIIFLILAHPVYKM